MTASLKKKGVRRILSGFVDVYYTPEGTVHVGETSKRFCKKYGFVLNFYQVLKLEWFRIKPL